MEWLHLYDLWKQLDASDTYQEKLALSARWYREEDG